MAELQHEITIGTSPLAAARVQAALIHGDIETGQTEMPGPHVQYVDKKGKDQSLAPKELNQEGAGNCASIPRAAAPFVDASHVGVVPVPQQDGSVVDHTFLIADAKPGEAPIQIGADGRALSPIPPARIVDPNVGHGLNGGKPLPPAVYQGAALAPIAPPGVPDLSHVHADPADRAAEGKSHQGIPRLHAPTTEKGVAAAVASHLAARTVDPHPAAEARPIAALYQEHPGEAIAERSAPGWKPTRRMVAQFASGLQALAAGHNPAPLPGDPKIEPHHQEAAAKILDHVTTLALAQVPNAPPAEKVIAVEKLAATAEQLKSADRSDPEHDGHATIVSEVEAMLPGMTPPHVADHIARVPTEDTPGAALSRDPFACDDVDFFTFSTDRGGGLDIPMSVAVSMALCHDALAAWRVGCPGDGNRCERPARRRLDPRMGSVGDAIEAILTGGISDLPREENAAEWRAHHELVERRRREYRELTDRNRGRFGGESRRELGGERPRATWDAGHWEGAPGAKHWDAGHFERHDRRMGALVVGRGWHGRDRYLVGNQSQRLVRAIRAYNNNPIVHARLDAGGRIYGIGLAEIQAATGVPHVVADVVVAGGFHGGGHGGGGGFHGGGGRGGFSGASFGTAYVLDDDTDDPSWYDPAMSGPGPSPVSPTPPTGAAPAPSPAVAPTLATRPGSAVPTAPAAREERDAARPFERREERPREERAIERRDAGERIEARVAERHWRDRFGRDRLGPIVAAEWAADRERRHWRDRWGRVRFEPIVVEEFVTEIDAPAEIEVVEELPAHFREPWWRRWFRWGGHRDWRMGGTEDADDDGPSAAPVRAIRCNC